jgi:hypothetical protein
MKIRLGGLLLVSTLALSSCSFEASVGKDQVESDELSTQVSNLIEQEVGRAPDSVDCPNPLDAEVGAEVRCTLTDGDTKLGVTVAAKEVKDERVILDIQVDNKPME